MDVITISSDSDTSLNEADVTLIGCSQNAVRNIADWDCENYDAWNYDEEAESRPPINYNLDSPKNEVAQQLHPEEEIENFVTPMKFSQHSVSLDVIGDADEEEATYERSPKAGSLLSSESENINSQISNCNAKKTKQKQKLTQEEKEREKLLKEQNKLDKEKKKIEQQRQKALKAVFQEKQKNLKPEENIKFLKVHIDNNVINSSFGGSVISLLQENNIQYAVEPLVKQFTVTWSKRKVEKVMDDFGELTENVNIMEENIMLYILNWAEALDLIHKNELLSHVETVRSAYHDKKLTLIIMGLETYFNYRKKKKNKCTDALENDAKKLKLKPSDRVFEEAPSITKDQLEFALTDLQLIGNYNCRLLETAEEISSLILNFTKSLSQIEFKLEKQKRQADNIGWVATDSHHSIKVDKVGNGLLRLWQQQICQFSSVGVETAQAIVSQYNSPLALVNQYKSMENSEEGELLLQNIQIRREAGLLSTSRRVGPQLSKKIYKFFTTDNPDLEL